MSYSSKKYGDNRPRSEQEIVDNIFSRQISDGDILNYLEEQCTYCMSIQSNWSNWKPDDAPPSLLIEGEHIKYDIDVFSSLKSAFTALHEQGSWLDLDNINREYILTHIGELFERLKQTHFEDTSPRDILSFTNRNPDEEAICNLATDFMELFKRTHTPIPPKLAQAFGKQETDLY